MTARAGAILISGLLLIASVIAGVVVTGNSVDDQAGQIDRSTERSKEAEAEAEQATGDVRVFRGVLRGEQGRPGVDGATIAGPPGPPGVDGETIVGPPGPPGPPIESFTFTDAIGTTYTCTDPENDGSYSCV